MPSIREIAESLLADLNRAESQSDGWSNQPLAQALVDLTLDRCLTDLAALGLWGRSNQLPSSEFWSIAGSVLERGPLHFRARFKPRGYAGDFETFAMFWERTTGGDPLGRLFDDYFQRQLAVEAVRARTRQIAGLIASESLHRGAETYSIASIGSGPAIEIELAAKLLPPSRCGALQVQLFDLDDAALAHAQRRLQAVLHPAQLDVRRENLYRLAERRNAHDQLQPADMIYCLGLFDYLPDEAAARLMRLMWQQVKPGGKLVVGNFAPHNPSRAYMEWFGNWYLLYRTPTQLLQLAESAEISASALHVGTEKTGVNLLLEAKKQANLKC